MTQEIERMTKTKTKKPKTRAPGASAIPAPHPDRDKEAAERRAAVKAERATWEARSADAYARMVAQTNS
jgi:hypothetical protein